MDRNRNNFLEDGVIESNVRMLAKFGIDTSSLCGLDVVVSSRNHDLVVVANSRTFSKFAVRPSCSPLHSKIMLKFMTSFYIFTHVFLILYANSYSSRPKKPIDLPFFFLQFIASRRSPPDLRPLSMKFSIVL